METARLRLRGLREGDEPFLASLDSDPDVMRYIHNGPLSAQEAEHVARIQVMGARAGNEWGKWMIERRADGVAIGWIELGKLSGPKRDDLQVGYELVRECWGQGYATEAVERVLRYAFEERGLDRVAAIARPGNTASIRVLEKNGFRLAGQKLDEGRVWCNLYLATAQQARASA